MQLQKLERKKERKRELVRWIERKSRNFVSEFHHSCEKENQARFIFLIPIPGPDFSPNSTDQELV
jgi:hypothetical protein